MLQSPLDVSLTIRSTATKVTKVTKMMITETRSSRELGRKVDGQAESRDMFYSLYNMRLVRSRGKVQETCFSNIRFVQRGDEEKRI